jgi:hypothetical protein
MIQRIMEFFAEIFKHDRELESNHTPNFQSEDGNRRKLFEIEPLPHGYSPTVLKRYSIHAKFTETKRKRRLTLFALDEEQAILKAMEKGFEEPFDLTEEPEIPTPNQVHFAEDLEIDIPENCSKIDLSYLITRRKGDPKHPNIELMDFAGGRGLLSSRYIGKKSLYNSLFSSLKSEDKVAFFIFCIYRYLSDDRRGNLDSHPQREIFYKFAEEMVKNQSFIKSMLKYKGKDLRFFGTIRTNEIEICGGSTNTIAYKKASLYLRDHFDLPLTRTKEFVD